MEIITITVSHSSLHPKTHASQKPTANRTAIKEGMYLNARERNRKGKEKIEKSA